MSCASRLPTHACIIAVVSLFEEARGGRSHRTFAGPGSCYAYIILRQPKPARSSTMMLSRAHQTHAACG